VHIPEGISREQLAWVMDLKNNRRGRISEMADAFPGVSYRAGKRPWDLPCDVAFPSATQNEVEAEDARNLANGGCKAVAEGANMPSTPGAVEIYRQSGMVFGPAKAANAGGVAVSALEMSQNADFESWTREEVDNKLQGIMAAVHQQCADAAEEYGVAGDLAAGANIAGFVKVANAMVAQGVA
jgi:glutamate dehydrogenase (NADP+)